MILIIVLVLLIAAASYAAHRPGFCLSKVELSGGVLVTEEEVSDKSLSFLSGSYLYLFPKNNVLWLPRKKLESYLKDQFKRIDTLDMQLKDFHTLQISIKERSPYAIWCDKPPAIVGDLTYQDSEKCYFLDQNSTVFAEAPLFSGDAYFKYYGLVSGDPLGKEYISSSTEFAAISGFIDSIKALNLHPLYLVADSDSQFSIILQKGLKIYFDTKNPLEETYQNLSALLKTKPLTDSLDSVDYIDLRFGNKLFYKMK